jgi:hypothetical protein
MTGLGFVTFGGTITDGTATTSPAVEIWSCSVALVVVDAWDPNSAIDDIYPLIVTWFEDADTCIHNTVTLDYVKANSYNILTGRQITDPTVEHQFETGLVRGGSGANTDAISKSYRVSIDNGTRDRRTRGGFFVPRTTMSVENNGRFNSGQVTAALGTASVLLDGLSNGFDASVGVWSRRDKSITIANRVRVGDVPDNISRRRNELRENYQALGIS